MKQMIKQNTVKSFLALAVCCASLAACKKDSWYDIKSDKSLVIPASLKDFQALLDNNLMSWNYPNMGEISSDDNYVATANQVFMSNNERNAFSWSKDQPYGLVRDWAVSGDGTFVRIFQTNIVIDGLKKLTPGEGDYNNVKGQALFQRSKNIYEAAQIFAPPYVAGTAATELGMPLRLESDANIPTKRSTLKETYDQIVNDLLEAERLLPVGASYITRGSKGAADALLARVYLSMEDYPNALVYADKALQLNAGLLDFNTLNLTLNPIIPAYGANKEVLFHSSIGGTNMAMQIDDAFYNSYEDNDLRKTIFFSQGANGIAVKTTYFYSNMWSGLANDEVYLIRAEAYARAGKKDEAMADLNALLKNRYVNTPANPYVTKTAADADDALRQILSHRRKELIRRGLRWSDLRRLNHDDRFKKTYTHVLGGKTYTLEPNSYKYTLPIPDDIILATQIPQNKGW